MKYNRKKEKTQQKYNWFPQGRKPRQCMKASVKKL